MPALLGGIWKRVGLLMLAAFLSVGIPSAAQGRKLYPVDEGKRNPSFRAFRQKLIAALRRWDRQFVLSALDPKIRYLFDGPQSLQGFKKEWKLDRSGRSWGGFRSELLSVLALGGSFEKGEFSAPYISSKWPEVPEEEVEDADIGGAILGRRVPVRSRPDVNAPVVTHLTYDIVKILEWSGNPVWRKIATPDGRQGYVPSPFLRSPIDYRAYFKKVKGRWKLTFFIAGD